MPKIKLRGKKNNQRNLVLRHLIDFKTITTWEAIKEYGVTRLSAVIFDLKADGYNITKSMISRKNRYGSKVAFAEYKLEEEKE